VIERPSCRIPKAHLGLGEYLGSQLQPIVLGALTAGVEGLAAMPTAIW
jgi:hypothetical protein